MTREANESHNPTALTCDVACACVFVSSQMTRRVMPDDRRRAVDAAMAHIPADGGAPSAADVARRAAVILRESGVDPGCPRVLAVNVRSRPDFQAALRAKRARADKGRALLAAADTPGWQIQRQSATSLAALASPLPASSVAPLIVSSAAPLGRSALVGSSAAPASETLPLRQPPLPALQPLAPAASPQPASDGDAQASSGARAISDDVALVGGSKGGAAMVDEDTSCVAKAADAAAAAGARAHDAAAPGGGASGEGRGSHEGDGTSDDDDDLPLAAAGGVRADNAAAPCGGASDEGGGGPGDWSSDDDGDVPLNRVSVRGPRGAPLPALEPLAPAASPQPASSVAPEC